MRFRNTISNRFGIYVNNQRNFNDLAGSLPLVFLLNYIALNLLFRCILGGTLFRKPRLPFLVIPIGGADITICNLGQTHFRRKQTATNQE